MRLLESKPPEAPGEGGDYCPVEVLTSEASGESYVLVRTLVRDKAAVAVLLAARVLCDGVSLGPRVAIKVSAKDPRQHDHEEAEGSSSGSQDCSVAEQQARAEVSALLRVGGGCEHVAGLLEAMEDEAGVMAVLPYLPGRDLCEKMRARQGRGLSERRAACIVAQVARGLEQLKRRGVAHG